MKLAKYIGIAALFLTATLAVSGTRTWDFDLWKSSDRTKTWTPPAATGTLVSRDSTDTLTNKTIDADGTGNSITNIENADIKASASIAFSKMAALTAARALETNGSGVIIASAVSATELGFVSGVTSAIQTQLDAKQASDSDLTAIAGLSSNGLIARTGSGTAVVRTVTAPAAGITVSNGDGVSGNPTLALANDLAALEGLGGTNTLYYRSASDTWSAVTIGSGLSFAGGTLSATASGSVGAVTSYNPTFTAFGSVTTYDFDYQEVGDFLIISGRFTGDTPSASEARISLPSGYTTITTDGIRNCGTWAVDNTFIDEAPVLFESGVTYLTFGYGGASSGGLVKRNGNAFMASGRILSLFCILPATN